MGTLASELGPFAEELSDAPRVYCDANLPANLIRFDDVVTSIRAGVAAGSFPASPGAWNDFYAEFENYGRCDFTRICARSRGDDFDRKEADAGVGPWSDVATAAAAP